MVRLDVAPGQTVDGHTQAIGLFALLADGLALARRQLH